jgi:phosphate ABC transporter phosphate-binding protein
MNPRAIYLTVAASVFALFVGTSAAHATTYAQIEGTGSTWSQNIVMQWIADVSSNGMQVVYTGGGSSKGRQDFAKGSVDYAISEIPYQGTDESGAADTSGGRDYAYLPIVAGGTAFTYQLKVGTTMVRNLRLSGDTLAKIFTNKITNWNDPAITKDNNGRVFPSLPITPVVRSDGSGTTAQLTTWLDKEYSSIWRPYFGRSGLTSYYPRKGRMIGAAGSDQVMNQIAARTGNGTIGYIEYSYPLNKTADDGKPFPVVKLLNKGGYYVEPTQYNVAVALTKARINEDTSSPLYLTQILDGVYNATDPRAYPLSSYSYMIIPTGKTDSRMTTAKRQTLADFMFYSLCAGQTKAGPYGYSPLPLNLVQAGFTQIQKLKAADPEVNLTSRDVTKCNNPTFVPGNLKQNKLAQIAPQPATCDKVNAGPCGTDTGTNQPSTDTPAAGGTTGGTTPGAVAGAPAAGAGPSTVDPETGALVVGTAAAAGQPVTAAATELVAARTGDTLPFAWAAAAELLVLVTAPGLYAAFLRRRRKGAL